MPINPSSSGSLGPKNPVDISNFDQIIQNYGYNPSSNSNFSTTKYPNFVSVGVQPSNTSHTSFPPANPFQTNRQIISSSAHNLTPSNNNNKGQFEPSNTVISPLPPPLPVYVNPHTGSEQFQTSITSDLPLTTSTSFINPLKPPIVNITEKFKEDESRYLLARFRDGKIYDKTRYLLSYFYDKDNSICYKGLTKLNILMSLKSEGLPSNLDRLRDLYFKYHALSEDISIDDVKNDLITLRNHINKERTNFMQVSNENYKKFYYPSMKKFF